MRVRLRGGVCVEVPGDRYRSAAAGALQYSTEHA